MSVYLMTGLAIVFGGALILGALYLLYTKKISLEQVLKSKSLEGEAIKVEIESLVKVSSNVPALGLFLVGLVLIISGLYYTDEEGKRRAEDTQRQLNITSADLEKARKELLKQRTYGRPSCIYFFTTNYDVLFEIAGALTGVVVETGFAGSVERFFDPQRFNTVCGALQGNARFAEHPELTVRLIKLHGSVSWFAHAGKIFERHPAAIPATEKRVMVLPRRGKVMDTLQYPYDTLFREMSQSLGTSCKYLVSCGFSYGDDHINASLIQPAVADAKIRLFALSANETAGMAALKTARAFGAGFDAAGISQGLPHATGTDLWKFSKFVELFA